MKSLTKRILDCQNNNGDWEAAEHAVSELVYRFAAGAPGLANEDYAEFLLHFYPRIRRLIERYRPIGSSFEAYLNTTLRWQVRSFVRERANEKIRAVTAEQSGATESAHGQSIERYRSERSACEAMDARRRDRIAKPESRIVPKRPCKISVTPRLTPDAGGLSPGESQRLLLLALKGTDYLDRECCQQLAIELGLDPDWLIGIWMHLWSCCDDARQRRTNSRVARDNAWFQLRLVEAELQRSTSSAAHSRLSRRITYWRRAYENAIEKLKHIHVAPTHKQIADALGIPKGTVDSSIFTARQELEDARYLARLARLFDRS
jgi:DNA-directed RNA polymerase specialized sigma24 family protein